MNKGMQTLIFSATSRLTDRFPRAGRMILDGSLRPILGSTLLTRIFAMRNQSILKNAKSFKKFLIVPDTHIGDSVMMQAVVAAVRDFFPDQQIDYVVNKTAASLVYGTPDASRIYPFFSGGDLPLPTDLQAIRKLLAENQYDLCINLCAFFTEKDLKTDGVAIVSMASHAPALVRNEADPHEMNHFLYQGYKFVRSLFLPILEPIRNYPFQGVPVTLSDQAIDEAAAFLQNTRVGSLPIIILSPDTASEKTRIPLSVQKEILLRLVQLDAQVYLGAGHSVLGMENILLASLPENLRGKVTLISRHMRLDTFSALLDSCDIFVTGDTGPMHIAAAHKRSLSGKYRFRNKTSVMSIFGATLPRMSGYDSFQPGYLPPNQDAPSWTYTAESPCRNITCINKMYKTCHNLRCFQHVDVDWVMTQIEGRLEKLQRVLPKESQWVEKLQAGPVQ